MRHDFMVIRWSMLALVCGGALACKRSPTDEQAALSVPPIPAIDERCAPPDSRVCVGDDVVACEANGVLGRRIQACHEGCEAGKCNATCADDGVGLIYVVDSAAELLSFDPRKLPGDPFERIGTLQCAARGGPFSMAVDRHGAAWVVYGDGQMFKVSISDASCRPTTFRPTTRFGMGFVTDTPGSSTEKLWLASDDTNHVLSFLDTTQRALAPQRVGSVAGMDELNPELTGTSEAKLYGFYPMTGKPSYVQEISRSNGAPKGPRWNLGKAPLDQVQAYAFAQWGGVFYIFVTTYNDDFSLNSTVRALDRATGSYRTVLEHLPYRITGAGVSTCAPERDQ